MSNANSQDMASIGKSCGHQVGAPAHTSNDALRYLCGRFSGRVMSKGGDWHWPARSPNLAICDLFLNQPLGA